MKKITREEILNIYEYEKARPQKMQEIIQLKKKRRVFIEPWIHLVSTFSLPSTCADMPYMEKVGIHDHLYFHIGNKHTIRAGLCRKRRWKAYHRT